MRERSQPKLVSNRDHEGGNKFDLDQNRLTTAALANALYLRIISVRTPDRERNKPRSPVQAGARARQGHTLDGSAASGRAFALASVASPFGPPSSAGPIDIAARSPAVRPVARTRSDQPPSRVCSRSRQAASIAGLVRQALRERWEPTVLDAELDAQNRRHNGITLS